MLLVPVMLGLCISLCARLRTDAGAAMPWPEGWLAFFFLNVLYDASSRSALGLFPPPSCLVSVPLLTASQPGPLAQQQPTGSTSSVDSQPGLVSPAAAPFPRKLVDRIQAGNFVEMKELLTNMALISQLETVQGWSPAHMLGPARPQLWEVASLATWCYCFMGYVAIRSSDPMTRSQLAYA